MHVGASYLTRALDRESIDYAVEQAIVKLSQHEFDTIAFLGMSGACFAPIIAHRMNKELIMVRRNDGRDGSGSGRPAEGNPFAQRHIIIDDLVSSGRTAGRIVKAVSDFCTGTQPYLVGIYCYEYNSFNALGSADYDSAMDWALRLRRETHVNEIPNTNQ